jgi:hypothetical protein
VAAPQDEGAVLMALLMALRTMPPPEEAAPAAVAKDAPRPSRLSASSLASAALGQEAEQVDIAADQRLLFRAAPAFDLPFRGNRIGNVVEFLMEEKMNRPPFGVAIEAPGIVLGYAIFERAPGRSHIVVAVRAVQ